MKRFYSTFKFEILYKSSKSGARVGRIHTPHGIIETPNFVPVGTNGTIKSLDSQFLKSLDVHLMFVNTFHSLVHPGVDIIEEAGGIHKFINRDQPIITDSGGFQVFSLAAKDESFIKELKGANKNFQENLVIKISELGVKFRNYRNGDVILLSPETSIDAQKKIGGDIIIPFDELPPYSMDYDTLKKSLERTHRWEQRSLERHLENPNDQAIYSVIHGGVNKDMRKESVEFLNALPFDGNAIGGSLGKDRNELFETVEYIMPILPKERPVHLLGIGDVESISKTIHLGIDTYDSAYPTRLARHGHLLANIPGDRIDIDHQRERDNFVPIENSCECYTCKHFTRSYLHHLFKMNEQTYFTLSTIHNIHFMNQMMKNFRKKILNGEI